VIDPLTLAIRRGDPNLEREWVCSVCSDVIRGDDTATDGAGELIHDDCAECDCCGYTVGTCGIICEMSDNEREGK